ncbi:hypothetical protein TNCV_3080341 [Trichonephila clavipes]|nr:hypothetical protein TNCV_3080341 [Trichonephila clavipes]
MALSDSLPQINLGVQSGTQGIRTNGISGMVSGTPENRWDIKGPDNIGTVPRASSSFSGRSLLLHFAKMKFFLILFFAVLAVASAQRTRPELCKGRPCRRRPHILPVVPLHRYGLDDVHNAASLGGADVGRYSRQQISRGGWGGLGHYQETQVSGLSLGGAKVGLYSRERDGHAPHVPLYG